MEADAARRAALARASAYVSVGADMAGRAAAAYRAGDDQQRELFAMEVESLVQLFDHLPPDDRDFILWVAFWRESTRNRRPSD